MNRASVLRLFDKLNVWSRGDQRAPHKPLLVLYALSRWSRGETADIPFKQLDADLTGLLKEFGPSRQSYHPEYPFWRLQNDGVWLVHSSGPLTPRQSSTDPKKSDLLALSAGRSIDRIRKVSNQFVPFLSPFRLSLPARYGPPCRLCTISFCPGWV
jgi:predicted restriction endonuclease